MSTPAGTPRTDSVALSACRRVLGEFKLWGIPTEVTQCEEVHTIGPGSGFLWAARVGRIHRTCGLVLCPCEAEEAAQDVETSCSLIHEMSHLIFENPGNIDEIASGMLALEYATARKLRHPGWKPCMKNYGLGTRKGVWLEWGDASWREKQRHLRFSLQEAEKRGVLRQGRITYRLPVNSWFRG